MSNFSLTPPFLILPHVVTEAAEGALEAVAVVEASEGETGVVLGAGDAVEAGVAAASGVVAASEGTEETETAGAEAALAVAGAASGEAVTEGDVAALAAGEVAASEEAVDSLKYEVSETPMKSEMGGKKVFIEPHRHEGVFIARGKEDALVTKNLVVGESVYGEKRVSVEEGETKLEYRVWNPFRSKLAAAILGGVDKIHMPPGSKVLYLGAASGTTVSHVADIVGPANCIDSTAEPEAVFAGEVEKLKQERLKPQEQITLEPYERDHAVVVGVYRVKNRFEHHLDAVILPGFTVVGLDSAS
ncbi:hypothetical protein HPB47_007070, partial [Ixodes persulcatus]